ncbi:MAG: GerMN domain-containing protein [bacterium]|jgi:spore germination protein GerM
MDSRSILILTLAVLLIMCMGIIAYLSTQSSTIPVQPLAIEPTPEAEESYPSDQGLVEISLYFLNREYNQLVAEKRQIHQPGTIAERIEIGVQELIKGPRSPDLLPTIPDDIELQTIFWNDRDGKVYVVLSPEFLEKKPTHALGEWATIYSIVSTVCALSPAIQQVQIMSDGEIIDSKTTIWDWSRPYMMNDAFLQYEISSSR